jgi:hypothetical protein
VGLVSSSSCSGRGRFDEEGELTSKFVISITIYKVGKNSSCGCIAVKYLENWFWDGLLVDDDQLNRRWVNPESPVK